MEEGTEKHRLYHCSEWHEIRRDIPEALRKWKQKARTSKNANRTPTYAACTDAHIVSAHTLHNMITFHNANTRGSRAQRLRIARNGVLKKIPSSTRHVSFLAAPDIDH